MSSTADEVIERLADAIARRPEPPDGLALLANLAALFADPKRFARQIQQFKSTKTAVEQAEAHSASVLAEHAGVIATDRAEIEAAWATVHEAERIVELREEQAERTLRAEYGGPPSDFQPIAGTSIVREEGQRRRAQSYGGGSTLVRYVADGDEAA
jgi:hypothetical protein